MPSLLRRAEIGDFSKMSKSIEKAKEKIKQLALGEREDPIDISKLQTTAVTSRRGPEYSKIIQGATAALSNGPKDLELLLWLSEAAIALHSAAGLRDALRLLRQFHDDLWDEVFPELEKASQKDLDMGLRPVDAEKRAAYVSKLIGRITQAVYVMPIAAARSGSPALSWKYDQDRSELVEALSATGPEQVRLTAEALADSLAVCDGDESIPSLDDVMLDRYGELVDPDQIPNFDGLRRAIEGALAFISNSIHHRNQPGAGGSSTGPTIQTGELGERSTSVCVAAGAQLPRTREEAFQIILNCVGWLELHEPQNLYTSRIRESVRHAKVRLEDLIAELIENDSERQNLLKRLGLRVV